MSVSQLEKVAARTRYQENTWGNPMSFYSRGPCRVEMRFIFDKDDPFSVRQLQLLEKHFSLKAEVYDWFHEPQTMGIRNLADMELRQTIRGASVSVEGIGS